MSFIENFSCGGRRTYPSNDGRALNLLLKDVQEAGGEALNGH
jgi:hypothetical protein